MTKKQKVVPRNQQRFVIVALFVYVLETIASLIFIAQNDFLREASAVLLPVTVGALLLPAALFVLAFASMQSSNLLRRLTRAVVWTFGGMLFNSIVALGWYASNTDLYGTDLVQLLYGPTLVTLVVYFAGLVIYRRNGPKADKLLVPGWFEKTFILLGFVYITGSVALILRDIAKYGSLTDSYILYSVVPLALTVLLTIIGFIVLGLMKNRVSRLYTSIFGVSFSLYIGTGLSQFTVVFKPDNSIQDFFNIGSYVVTTLVFLILLKRVHNRLRAKENS